MLECTSIDSSMDVNMKLLPDQRELLEDAGRCRRLMRQLNYITRPDITFAVSVVSQFLSVLRTTHLEMVMRILRYVKKIPGEGFFIQIRDKIE